MKKLSVVLLVLTVIFLFASCAKKPEYIDYSKQNIQFAQSLTDAKAIVYADKSFGSKTNVETRSGENKALFKITTADDIKELNIYGKGYKWNVDKFLQINQREFLMRIHVSEKLSEICYTYLSNPRVIYTDVTNPASPVMYEFPYTDILNAQRVDDAIYFIAQRTGLLKFDIPSKQIITVIPYELYNIVDFYFLDNNYVLISTGEYFNHIDINGEGNLLCYSINENKIYKDDKKFGTLLFKNDKIIASSDYNLLIMEFDKDSKQFYNICSSDYYDHCFIVECITRKRLRGDNNTFVLANYRDLYNYGKIKEVSFVLDTEEPTILTNRVLTIGKGLYTSVGEDNFKDYAMQYYSLKNDLYVYSGDNAMFKFDPNSNTSTKLFDRSEYTVVSDFSEGYKSFKFDDDYIYFSGYINMTATKFRCNIVTGVVEATESNPVEPIIVIPFN